MFGVDGPVRELDYSAVTFVYCNEHVRRDFPFMLMKFSLMADTLSED